MPEEYSESYRRLVKQDFTDDDFTEEGHKRYGGLSDLLTRVNMTRDGMDEDEEFVTSSNFSAIGCILLEFTNA
jgi:hypothetical protein